MPKSLKHLLVICYLLSIKKCGIIILGILIQKVQIKDIVLTNKNNYVLMKNKICCLLMHKSDELL